MVVAGADRLCRSSDDRVVAGVAAGLAHRLGIAPVVVRCAFVVLTLAAGTGAMLYVLGWLLLPDRDAPESIGQTALRERQDSRAVLALGMLVLGGLLLLRETGVWFGDAVVWPVALAAVGLYVIWRQADPEERAPLTRLAVGLPRSGAAAAAHLRPGRSLVRVVPGVLLVAAGVAVFLAANDALESARQGILGTAAVVTGLALISAPWWWRLARALAAERRERIRSEERAELAARVHDSVLQTLTLIQRSAGDAGAVTRLARRQERELRSWLYPAPARAQGESLAAAVSAVGAEVEDVHAVAVEVVTVGDCPVDDGVDALVQAAREALVNAARHSGAAAVSLYSEVEPERVTVFVRDRGAGFDPAAVGPDRRGIAESIVGRMQRHGGTAAVRSRPGEGTEVELVLPRGDR